MKRLQKINTPDGRIVYVPGIPENIKITKKPLPEKNKKQKYIKGGFKKITEKDLKASNLSEYDWDNHMKAKAKLGFQNKRQIANNANKNTASGSKSNKELSIALYENTFGKGKDNPEGKKDLEILFKVKKNKNSLKAKKKNELIDQVKYELDIIKCVEAKGSTKKNFSEISVKLIISQWILNNYSMRDDIINVLKRDKKQVRILSELYVKQAYSKAVVDPTNYNTKNLETSMYILEQIREKIGW